MRRFALLYRDFWLKILAFLTQPGKENPHFLCPERIDIICLDTSGISRIAATIAAFC
jgi:hypothetical protein